MDLFDDNIKIHTRTKVCPIWRFHSPIALIFSRSARCSQFDDEGLGMARFCRDISGLNDDVVAFYVVAGNIGQKSEGVACVPCAGSGIL